MLKTLLILLVLMNVNSPINANDIFNTQIKSFTTPEHIILFVKNENNWIQKKEKDEWIALVKNVMGSLEENKFSENKIIRNIAKEVKI